MSGIQYPVDIKHIGKFEHQNNISVKLYEYEDKKIFPLRITTAAIAKHHMNLLYITTGYIKPHYVLVKDLSREHQVNIIITKAKHISVDNAFMAAPVKGYWKTIWKDASYTRYKESSSQKLTTR